MPRGSRPGKKAKLVNWRNKKASHGRRGAHGKKNAFPTWKQVRATIMRKKTVLIAPPKEEQAAAEAAAAEATAAEATAAE